MKRIFIIILILSVQFSFAQVAEDALMLSRWHYEGNARVTAMGGAFTALGGNLSSASINPAGLGLYRSNDFSFSLAGSLNSTTGTYLTANSDALNYRTIMPNMGIAMSSPNIDNLESDEGPKSWTFAIGYNQLYNYNRSYDFNANNETDSYLDYVGTNLNNGNFDQYEIFNSSGLVFYDSTSGDYVHDYNYPTNAYGTRQQKSITETGSIGEYFISGAANYGDNFYFGATVGIQSVYLKRNFGIFEDPNNEQIELNWFDYSETLISQGIGINAKIGFIYAPIYWAKIGASFHTPTVYKLTDDKVENIQASFKTYSDADISTTIYYADYEILSPMRVNAGASFLILRRALLSVDYEYVDHSLAQINSSSYAFTTENQNIEDWYQPTHMVKVGGEYKISIFSIRAGGFYGTSPFQSELANKDNTRMGYSGGLGLRSGSYYFDFAFSQMTEDFKSAFYNNQLGEVDSKKSMFLATIGFRF